MVYVDAGAFAVALYDTLIPVAQMAPLPPEINPMVLPTSDFFAPNLGGTVFGLNMDADGVAAEGYSATGVISFLAVAAPAAFQARRMAGRAFQAEAAKREEALEQIKQALQAYAKDNGGNLPAALKELQPRYLPENTPGLDQFAYRGKQDAPNKVVAHSSERQRGPITLLLQDGSVVRIGRGQLGRVLKDGFVAQPADNPPAPENKPAAQPPRPPDNNF
jgi:type II secretory pathway pseudopilin PulG